MNATKKMLAAVLLLSTVLGFAFAQQSMTSLSTQDLFTTDVDDFMNVNEYHNVMPEKFFAFLGYGKEGTGDLQFGFAKQLKAVYLGTFFEGKFAEWTSKTTTDNDGKKDILTQTENDAKTKVAVLVGFNNMGVRADFSFKPKGVNNKHTKNEVANTEKTDNKFNLDAGVTFGMNINGPKDKLFKTKAELALDSLVDKSTDINNTTNTTTITDKSEFTLNVNGGVAFDFMQKDAVTHTLGLDLDTAWKIWPIESSKTTNASGTSTTKIVGRLEDTITLTPTWEMAYEPEGKFAFKAGATLPIEFFFENDLDYTETTLASGTIIKDYQITTGVYDRKYKFNTQFSPTLVGAMTWKPISKLAFNFGAKFDVPVFGWRTTKTEARNANGDVQSTTTVVDWMFNRVENPGTPPPPFLSKGAGTFEASSGLTWFVNDKVTVDGNWNIVSNLFKNKFKTDLNEGNYNFFNTFNKVLVHNVSFLVAVKL